MIRHGTIVPIGAGATSRVYKARDEVEGRWLAIKVLLHDDPATRLRLMREARAVSTLSHPHICPVLEVGEHEGRARIVMPYIEGRTLGEALGELSLESRVRVLAQAAEAVHHAHEQGLLHRDIKPDNLLVEMRDGLPHAWVLDFGLVREMAQPAVTRSGDVLGTPAFMSPEQARGTATLDRRSDVFALGATLYFVLAGHPPFAAPSTAETLLKVMQEEAPALRRVRRDLPRDLEAIVAMALEKSPARRYDSALALAEDLRRFLAGRRPLARNGLPQRLRRALRAHPLRFTLLGALLLSLLASSLLGIYWAAQSAERARLSRESAAAAERARRSLQLEYLRPAHPIDDVLDEARDTAVRLARAAPADEAELHRANLVAAAQLWTDLDDDEAALQALRQAAAVREDEALRRALGLVHARLYRRALSQPQPFADRSLRMRRRDGAERRWLEPARAYLVDADRQPQAWAEAAELAQAAGDGDAAAAALIAGFEREPARYDALLAAAEMHMVRGVEAHWSSDFAAARDRFETADALLVRALEHGRSDPRVHRRRCELASLRMDAQNQGVYDRDASAFDDDACDAALGVRARDPLLHAVHAHLLGARARLLRSRGDDVMPVLRAAVASGETAAALAPRDPRVAQELALALMRLSTQQRWSGERSPEAIERAVAVLDAAQSDAQAQGVDFLLIRGQVEGERAQVREQFGEDPAPHYGAAIDAFRLAVERVPEASFLRLNLANALSQFAYWRALQGRPDTALVEESITQLTRVLEAEPERASAWAALANAQWDLAMARAWRGDDAADAIADAERRFDGAVARDPGSLTVLFNRYGFTLFVAAEQLRQGVDPSVSLRRAGALIEAMDARSEGDWITACPRAEHPLRLVQAAARQRRLDQASLQRARTLLDAALQAAPSDHDCARRRVDLAAASLPLLSDERARAEFSAAQGLVARHPDSLELSLSLLALLQAACDRGDLSEPGLVEQRSALLRRLDATTEGRWAARLRPYRDACTTSAARPGAPAD